MLYTEFKDTYKYSCKRWPDVTNAYENERFAPLCVTTHQEKAGSKWETIDKTTETVNGIYYMNVIDAVSFFRNIGGTETVQKNYTRWGLIPTRIISTNPDKDKRTIREFIF